MGEKRPPEALLLGVVSLFAGAALQPFQVIGLKDNLLIGGDVHHHAGPVGMDLAGLLDEDVIENIIGNAVGGIGLHDGGVGQGLVIGQLHALVVEVEAAAHPAAVQTGVFRDLLQIVQDLVRLVEVFGSGGSVVKAELDVGAGKLAEALNEGDQVLLGIILVENAVDPEGHRQPGQQRVVGFHHIVLHVAGDVDAGDLVSVPLRKCQNVRLGLVLGDGKGGVDIYLVGSGDFVQHHLEGLQVGEGLTPGEDEVAVGRDGVHPLDAPADLLQGKTCHIRILAFIDAEGAVVVAVVGHENRDGCAALAGLIGVVAHMLIQSSQKIFPNILYRLRQKSKEFLIKCLFILRRTAKILRQWQLTAARDWYTVSQGPFYGKCGGPDIPGGVFC